MTMVDTAKSYLSAGISVIPIRKDDKKPTVAWMQYNDHPMAIHEAEKLFSGDVNIGIVTGPVSGLIVVDIDDPSQYEPFSTEFPTGRIAKTPKGYHLYYEYHDTDIKNSVKAIRPGIDVRGWHGYVVVPPSHGYEWMFKGKPALVTTKLHKLIMSANPLNVALAQPGPVNNNRDAAELYERVKREGFTKGAHNQELKDVARYLYRMGELEPAIISTVSILNAKDPTPLPEVEMLKTIHSGLAYERQRLESKLSPDAREWAEVSQGKINNQLSVLEAKQQAIDKFDATPWGDLVVDYADAASKWLIEEWLPESAVMVTAAPPESYKTWIGLEAGVNVAFGDKALPFLGAFTGKADGEPVLIVQQEDYMGLLIDRLSTIVSAKTRHSQYDEVLLTDGESGEQFYSFGSAFDAPIMLHTQSKLSFEDDNSLLALEAKIAKYGIKYVMIDPLYMLGRADDYFASLALKMGEIKRMRDAYGTTFMFIHHNKKGTKGAKAEAAGERENMFGSQLLNGSFEGIWLLNTVTDKERIITRRGKVFPGTMKQYLLTFDILTNKPKEIVSPIWEDLGVDVETGRKLFNSVGISDIDYIDERRYTVRTAEIEQNPYNDNEQAALDIISDFGVVTATSLADKLSVTRTTSGKILEKLVARGVIELTPETRTKKVGWEYQFREQF